MPTDPDNSAAKVDTLCAQLWWRLVGGAGDPHMTRTPSDVRHVFEKGPHQEDRA